MCDSATLCSDTQSSSHFPSVSNRCCNVSGTCVDTCIDSSHMYNYNHISFNLVKSYFCVAIELSMLSNGFFYAYV